MRYLPFSALVFALLLGAQATSNKATSEARPFVGQWSASFEGRNFMKLDLRDADPLSGRIKTGEIAVDSSGKLIYVAEGDGDEYDLVGIKIVGNRMFFQTKEEDGDLTKYEFALKPDGKAQLAVTAEGVKVQPFVLERARP